MSDYKATGGCLCGGIVFEYTKPLVRIRNCHCTMCRRSIGASFGTFGDVPHSDFKILKQENLCKYRSSEEGHRVFCGTCGCSLFYEADNDPSSIQICLATVDGDSGSQIECEIHTDAKAPWVHIN